jgi:hypothetical protein
LERVSAAGFEVGGLRRLVSIHGSVMIRKHGLITEFERLVRSGMSPEDACLDISSTIRSQFPEAK